MRIRGFSGWSSLLLLAFSAQADIYRCEGSYGEPSFSGQRCASGSTVAVPQSQAAARDAPGLRPAERAWLEQRRRVSKPTARPKVSRSSAERSHAKAAYRCLRKRRALDAVKAEMRRGYKAGRGEKLRRRRRGYEDYLAAFCS